MFKKNDTLRNVLLAGLACVTLIFAGCNQAVDDGNYVKLNDGENVTVATAIDAITNQRGGTIFVKIGPVQGNGVQATKAGDLALLVEAIKNNPNVMVELDLSEAWNDADEGAGAAGKPDLFGGVVEVADATVPGSRKITTMGKIGSIPAVPATDVIFSGLKNLVKISLPFTVQTIGDRAFEGCENLEEVKINFFFTKDVDKTNLYATEYMFDDKFMLTSIGNSAFAGCKNLRTFIVVSDPDNAEPEEEGFPVSLSVIGAGAFKDCYSLKGIRFINTQNAGLEPHEVEGVPFVAHDLLNPAGGTPLAPADYFYFWPDADGVSRNPLTTYSSGINYEPATGFGGADAFDIYIGTGAFENCKDLEYVDFTNKRAVITGVTAPATIDKTATESTIAVSAFSGCESLSAIFVPVRSWDNALFTTYPRYAPYELGTTNPGRNGAYNSEIMTFKPITVFGDYSFQFTAIGNETLHDLFHFTDFAEPTAANSYHGPDAHVGVYGGGATTAADVVKAIGKRAFFGCQNISEVLLPSLLTNTAGNMAYDGAATGIGTKGLGDGAFANTGVQYIWIHDNNQKIYSILEDWRGGPKVTGGDTYTDVAPYWTGALVNADPAADAPTTIYAWYVTPFSGDLTYLPRTDSQNPRTKVLGDKLADIRADAFYNNVDVEKILFPATVNGTDATTGIGSYAFANAENLEEAYTELKVADWATAADAWNGTAPNVNYFGTFTNTQVYKIHASDADSGRVAR